MTKEQEKMTLMTRSFDDSSEALSAEGGRNSVKTKELFSKNEFHL